MNARLASNAFIREAALFGLAAAAYRLAFWIAMPRVIDTADAIHYLQYAQQILDVGFRDLDPRITPLFPIITALVASMGIDVELAARIVSFTAGSLTIPAAYALALQLFGRNPARITALAMTIWPWLADYSCRVAPEALAVLLWITAAGISARAVLSRHPLHAAAFACWFSLHLTRPEGTVLLLAAGVAVFAAYPQMDLATRARSVASYMVAAVVGLIASTFALGAVTGQTSVSGRVPNVVETANHIFIERGTEMAQAFLTLFTQMLPVMLGPFLLLFAGAGLFMRRESAHTHRAELVLLFLCAVQFACAVLSTYAEPRYLMPVVITGAMYAARGIALVSGQIPRSRPVLRRLPVAALVGFMVLGTTVTLLPEYLGRVPREPREYKIAGLWMKNNLDPGVIFTRKPQIGFYAGMETTGPEATESLEQCIARARHAQAEYLVVDERYTAQMAPALAPLLNPANAPAQLELVRADLSPYENARVVIYRVLPDGSPPKPS